MVARSLDVLRTCDTFGYWAVNVSAAFLLSAAHNVLLFVLDIRTPVLHFLHNAITFALLAVVELLAANARRQCAVRRCKSADAKARVAERHGRRPSLIDLTAALMQPALLQLVCTWISSFIHSQNRAGSLYLLRLFDFLTTLTALKVASCILGGGSGTSGARSRGSQTLMLPIALSASLSWLELTHIEYDRLALLLSPLLAVVQGVHIVLLKKSMRKLEMQNCGFESAALAYTGLVSTLLAVPALISYLMTVIPVLNNNFVQLQWRRNVETTLFERDYFGLEHAKFLKLANELMLQFLPLLLTPILQWLMFMSIAFMFAFKYSELWMIAHIELREFCILEHSKYFLASCGQWFLQNMANATVFAACGKTIFVASVFRYWSLARHEL